MALGWMTTLTVYPFEDTILTWELAELKARTAKTEKRMLCKVFIIGLSYGLCAAKV